MKFVSKGKVKRGHEQQQDFERKKKTEMNKPFRMVSQWGALVTGRSAGPRHAVGPLLRSLHGTFDGKNNLWRMFKEFIRIHDIPTRSESTENIVSFPELLGNLLAEELQNMLNMPIGEGVVKPLRTFREAMHLASFCFLIS